MSNTEKYTLVSEEEHKIYVVAIDDIVSKENIEEAIKLFPQPLEPLNVYALSFKGDNQNIPKSEDRLKLSDKNIGVVILSPNQPEINPVIKAHMYIDKLVGLVKMSPLYNDNSKKKNQI